MKKEFDAAKIIAAAFLAATAVIFAALVAVRAYTGGQAKTVSNVCTAITRNIYEDYKSCFSEGKGMSKGDFDSAYSDYVNRWGDGFHLTSSYVARTARGGGYDVTFNITVYNDLSHETEQTTFYMVRQNGKWLIQS